MATAFFQKKEKMREVHYVAKATIADQEQNTVVDFKLPTGFVVGVALYSNGVEKTIDEMCSVEMKDDNSMAIIPSVHIDNWRQASGGEYLKTFKPLNFDTGNKDYSLTFALDGVNTSGRSIKFHVVFLYNNNVKLLK